jgi:hypothetical protein
MRLSDPNGAGAWRYPRWRPWAEVSPLGPSLPRGGGASPQQKPDGAVSVGRPCEARTQDQISAARSHGNGMWVPASKYPLARK